MKKIKLKVSEGGYVSLVGFIRHEFPMKHGNYFSLDGHHVLNMWYENLAHLKESGVIGDQDELEAMEFKGGAVITDPRIPEEYLNKTLCFTGAHGEIGPLDELYKFFHKDLNHLECLCCEEAGYVSYRVSCRTMGDYPFALTEGRCHLCRRPIFMNHGREISQEEYGLIWNSREEQ